MSEDTGLGSVTTNEANSAVSAVLQHQSDGAAEGRKRKYTYFTPGQRAILINLNLDNLQYTLF